jgi:hypothetical protein
MTREGSGPGSLAAREVRPTRRTSPRLTSQGLREGRGPRQTLQRTGTPSHASRLRLRPPAPSIVTQTPGGSRPRRSAASDRNGPPTSRLRRRGHQVAPPAVDAIPDLGESVLASEADPQDPHHRDGSDRPSAAAARGGQRRGVEPVDRTGGARRLTTPGPPRGRRPGMRAERRRPPSPSGRRRPRASAAASVVRSSVTTNHSTWTSHRGSRRWDPIA